MNFILLEWANSWSWVVWRPNLNFFLARRVSKSDESTARHRSRNWRCYQSWWASHGGWVQVRKMPSSSQVYSRWPVLWAWALETTREAAMLVPKILRAIGWNLNDSDRSFFRRYWRTQTWLEALPSHHGSVLLLMRLSSQHLGRAIRTRGWRPKLDHARLVSGWASSSTI